MPSPRSFGSNAIFLLSCCGRQLDDVIFRRGLYSATPIADLAAAGFRDIGSFRKPRNTFAMETQLKGLRNVTPDLLDGKNTSTVGGGVSDTFGEDAATEDQTLTPWARIVASGSELLRDPRYNKGLAFTEEERDRHYLRGLLPPTIISQELQVERVLQNVRSYKHPLEKYIALMDLQERNERLFYKVLIDRVEELLPIVYTPVVGEACQKYGNIFRRPRGLYISLKDRGRVLDLLKNWPERNVQVIVVTDGERILGLGDLGLNEVMKSLGSPNRTYEWIGDWQNICGDKKFILDQYQGFAALWQGMGIPVGKLALYTALGGIRPSSTLPVAIDVGTNNGALLKDPFYIGLRQKRTTGKEYDDLLDEFMMACKQAYGEKVLIQFEDFANHNAFRLLQKYATSHLVFNDDIQGTAAVALAGLVAALPITGGTLADHKILFLGAGEAGTGIAEIIALEVSRQITKIPMKIRDELFETINFSQEGKMTVEEARKAIHLVDSKGLVTKSRYESLQEHKRPYAHDSPPARDLLSAVKALKPTVLIGTSGKGGTFTKEVLEEICSYQDKPIIMALSNPTSQSECTAEDAYKYTKGKCVFASGSPFDPVTYEGKTYVIGQSNNCYIFPGVGLGCAISGAVRVHDDMFLAAAEALAKQIDEEHLAKNQLYPAFSEIREISAHVGAAVAAKAYELGLATRLPKPKDLFAYAKSCMYSPSYRKYR